ncbi:MAG: helix-turn-helix transcriptional regulator [Spirochaetales bacterium]|nr:helix-turn-helix transcriptional regulator [Spirochaetales bacterium]
MRIEIRNRIVTGKKEPGVTVHLLYFTSAVACIVFSLLMLVTQLVLRIESGIFLIGLYFFFLSIVALLHACILSVSSSPYIRELVILERIAGLCCGFPIVLLIRRSGTMLQHTFWIVVFFCVLGFFLVISLIDLLFCLRLLFTVESGRLVLQPLFRYVFIPFSICGLALLSILLCAAYRPSSGKYAKLMRTFSLGIIILLPFECWDLSNGLVRENVFSHSYYFFNAGAFLFLIFMSVIIIQFIQIHLQSGDLNVGKTAPQERDTGKRLSLENVYLKTVRKMKEDRLYVREDLSVKMIAALLDEPRNRISKAVNLFFNDNFSAFVNHFRIEEMKRQLEDPDQRKSVLQIGIDAGFNSRTSINRIFYRKVRLTPVQYRKMVLRSDVDGHEGLIHITEIGKKSDR